MSQEAYQIRKGVVSPQDGLCQLHIILESWGYVHSAVIAYGIVIIICHLVCVMEQKTFDGK
jgi:hypothetical protein